MNEQTFFTAMITAAIVIALVADVAVLLAI